MLGDYLLTGLFQLLVGMACWASVSCDRERSIKFDFVQDHRSGSAAMRDAGGAITLLYQDPAYDSHAAQWERGIDNGFIRRLQEGETLAVAADDGIWLIHIVSVEGRVQAKAKLNARVLNVGEDNESREITLNYGDELFAGTHAVSWLPVDSEVVVSFDSPVDGEIAFELGVIEIPDQVRVFRHRFSGGRVIDLPAGTAALVGEKSEAEQGVAPQSATRSESDSEGVDKLQPESEPRPR